MLIRVNQESWKLPSRLVTDEFVVRAYELEDAEELTSAMRESYDRLAPWMNWAEPDPMVTDTFARIHRLQQQYAERTDFTMGIWQGETCVGSTGFHMRRGPLESGFGENGMWIRTGFHGQGLAVRVLMAMVEWGFREWGFHTIVWACDENNMASRRVAEKAEFKLATSCDEVPPTSLERCSEALVYVRRK
jgi:RimJ/RimL family protein N-acetyltransferase